MQKLLLSFILSIFLVSCTNTSVPDSLKPAHRVFSHMPQGGSSEYEDGWQDGCESGMSGMTNSFYQSFYYFKQQKRLLANEVYYKAWKDSYDYCKGYIYGILKEANMRRSLPHSRRHFLPEAKGKNVMGGIPVEKQTSGSGFLGWLDNTGPGLFRW